MIQSETAAGTLECTVPSELGEVTLTRDALTALGSGVTIAPWTLGNQELDRDGWAIEVGVVSDAKTAERARAVTLVTHQRGGRHTSDSPVLAHGGQTTRASKCAWAQTHWSGPSRLPRGGESRFKGSVRRWRAVGAFLRRIEVFGRSKPLRLTRCATVIDDIW
jgi:hypothetical protein